MTADIELISQPREFLINKDIKDKQDVKEQIVKNHLLNH